MNTNKLKTFAKEARKTLLQGVKNRLLYWGFDEKGQIVEEIQTTKGGYIFRENVYDDPTVSKKWQALKEAIHRHSVNDVIEEAAYTWFNRLMAIKILEKNNYISATLEYISDSLSDPHLLQDARKENGHFSSIRFVLACGR